MPHPKIRPVPDPLERYIRAGRALVIPLHGKPARHVVADIRLNSATKGNL